MYIYEDTMPKFSIILWKSYSLFNIVLELYDYKQYFKVLFIYSRLGAWNLIDGDT